MNLGYALLFSVVMVGLRGSLTLDERTDCKPFTDSIHHLTCKMNKRIAFEERNKRAIKSLYNDLVYPQIKASINDLLEGQLPVYLADDCKGRANPLGDFGSIKGVTEYFYASVYASGMIISDVVFVDLIAEAEHVYYRVDGLFTSSSFPNPTNLTQIGRAKFNEKSQITSMEFTNMNLGYLMDHVMSHAQRVKAICSVAVNYCDGSNLQYNSFKDCSDFLSTLKEGSWNRVNSNTVVCRQYHAWLATVDPSMHCSHIGPSGGGKCIDFTYGSYYHEYF
jgi:hypothetical protein